MIIINTTPKFEKSFSKLPKDIIKLFELKETLFINNPFHSSLKTHRLKGKLKKFWSFAVSYSYRIMFIFEKKNNITFVDIGTHEIYK